MAADFFGVFNERIILSLSFHYLYLLFCISVHGCILAMQSSPGLNSRIGSIPLWPVVDFTWNVSNISHLYMFSVDFTTWKFHSNVKFANSYYHEVVLNFYLRFFFLYFHTCSNALSSLSINIVNSNSLCWQNHFRGDTTILLGDT